MKERMLPRPETQRLKEEQEKGRQLTEEQETPQPTLGPATPLPKAERRLRTQLRRPKQTKQSSKLYRILKLKERHAKAQ